MVDLRLLYVEDEADIREVANFALEDENFELLFCSSGPEAIEKAVDFKPDLLLLDVMMPGMDGKATLKSIRKLDGLEDVPAIFVTAKVQQDELTELYNVGALDVIPKPFDPMTLAEQIMSIWGRSHN